MMSSDRVKTIRQELGLSQKKFADALGVAYSRINNLESRNQPVAVDIAELISECYGYNFRWILTGKGEKIEEINDSATLLIDGEDIVQIPVKDEIMASAGTGYINYCDESSEFMIFTLKFCRRLGLSPEHSHIISVYGQSMYPTFEDCDEVIIDTSKKRIIPNKVYACVLNDETYIKRIKERPTSRYFNLYSDNEEYDDVEVDLEVDNFRIVGQVMWLCRDVR